MDRGSLRDLACLLADGAEEAPWWHDSHERVLQKARALDKQDAEELPAPADTTPFRHQE